MLSGKTVQLEPLSLAHAAELSTIGLEPSLWEVGLTQLSTPAHMEAYIASALADPKAQPFAVRHLPTGRLAGSTRYMNIERAHKRLEIGSTWYGLEFQRTAVNTETKLLLLTHAFEELQVNRVELKTDARNERSQQAMLRLGAKFEGTLRSHMITSTGYVRDTVYFSILRTEWPAVRAHLESLQARYDGR